MNPTDGCRHVNPVIRMRMLWDNIETHVWSRQTQVDYWVEKPPGKLREQCCTCWSARLCHAWQISSGEEGWRVDGGNGSSWITNGTKGVDFAGNLELFDFATVHLCELPPTSTHANKVKNPDFRWTAQVHKHPSHTGDM